MSPNYPMNDEAAFLRAMQEHPEDTTARLVYADWLEERGDLRGELIRLLHTLMQNVDVPARKERESRLRALLASVVQPVGPFFTNSLGMKFAWIPAGTFLMGSPEDEEGRSEYETQHRVTLTQGFYLSIHPVTQAIWEKVMGNNPSHFKGDELPVECVSWVDCQEFHRKLSKVDGCAYRLSTEAEWEYACRAGTTSPFYFGETISTDQANYDGNYKYGTGKKGKYRKKTTPIGTFPANAWGLFDMHGNVWEWCEDWYGEYSKEDVNDPNCIQEGVGRVLRGGSWAHDPWSLRSATRDGSGPTYRNNGVGFRSARTFTAG